MEVSYTVRGWDEGVMPCPDCSGNLIYDGGEYIVCEGCDKSFLEKTTPAFPFLTLSFRYGQTDSPTPFR